MANVYELTHGFQNVVHDLHQLVFPNVLTCMAFIAYDGARLIGVHFTQMDQSVARIQGAWARVQAISGGPHDVYVAGPAWNVSLLTALHPMAAALRGALTPSGVDVRATLAAGVVTVEHAPAGAGGPWVPLVMA